MNLNRGYIIIISDSYSSYYTYPRLCRAIALAAKDIKLSCTIIEDGTPRQKDYNILSAVVDAQKYIKDHSSGSLDGFLALTDSIIYAIKIANPEDSSTESQTGLKAVSAYT